MPEGLWMIVLLALVAALVYGAYLLGRASALAERRGTDDAAGQIAPEAPVRRELPRTSSTPPPAAAGGDSAAPGGHSGAQAAPRRSAAPPPAAAAGPPSQSASAGAGQSAPRRTATPPPAQAAWANPKDGSPKGK